MKLLPRPQVRQIKAIPNYNEALGIEGFILAPDLTTAQPVIDARLSGNALRIRWGWGGNTAFLDMCEIQVDRGSGWTLLAFDTTPNYTDIAPLPATPGKWKYRVRDHQVGVWSNTVELTVG